MIANLSSPSSPEAASDRRRLQEFIRWILKKISLADVRRVLDYGCGTGELTRLLADQLGERTNIVGIDPIPKAIRTARADTDPARYPHVEYRTVKTERLPFHEGEFDFALCIRALMPRENPQALLRELARVLKPGGRLLAVEVDLGGYFISELQALPPDFLLQLNPYIARALASLVREIELEPSDLFPDFVVSREPLTRDLLEQPDAPIKSLRPRLRHLERLDLNDYIWQLQSEVAAQSRGAHATLLQVGLVARKK
jgi:SAM-dependent methyltransferase